MNKAIPVIAIIIGIIGIILAIYYWVTPSGNLPSFFPGYTVGSSHVHFKHGLAALILGLLAFVIAWFTSKNKPTH